MKSKKEYILAGIVIIILAAYLVIHKTDKTHYELPVIPELSQADITSITISKTNQTIELKKKDDKWVIYPKKYPADNAKVDAMVDIIKSLKVTALVSESKNYNRYELDPKHKISVQAGSGEKVLRGFDMGKAAPSNRHTFIKLPDDDSVYHARESFRNKFDTTIDALRDNTVLTVDKDQIQQIAIKDKDGNLVLSMKKVPVEVKVASESEKPGKSKNTAPQKNITPELVWQDADGKPVKESDINNLFANISNLKCQSYIVDKTKADFIDPMYILTMTGTKTYILSVFEKINKDDDAYPAISSENDYPFMLPAYKMDNMVKK